MTFSPSYCKIQVPSPLLTTVNLLAPSSGCLLPLSSSETTRQVPSYFFRSFLIASCFSSSAAARKPRHAKTKPIVGITNEVFIIVLQSNRRKFEQEPTERQRMETLFCSFFSPFLCFLQLP